MKDKEKQHWLSFHEMVACVLDVPSSVLCLPYTAFSLTVAPACEGHFAGWEKVSMTSFFPDPGLP